MTKEINNTLHSLVYFAKHEVHMAATRDIEELDHSLSTGGPMGEFSNTENDDSPLLETHQQKINRIYRNIKILRAKHTTASGWNQEDEVNRVSIVCDVLRTIHDSKSQTYGPSWKKRGWVVSIFGNIARKFDRLEKIFTDPSLVIKFVEKPDLTTNEESITDTFADSAVYSLLALTEVMVTKPEVFDQWFEKSFNVKIQK